MADGDCASRGQAEISGYFRKCLVPRPWLWLVVSFPLRLGTKLPHVMSPTSGHPLSAVAQTYVL